MYQQFSSLHLVGLSKGTLSVLLQDINDKILSLNLSGSIAKVSSVDAQYSLSGGVTVLVTGEITTAVCNSTVMNHYAAPDVG